MRIGVVKSSFYIFKKIKRVWKEVVFDEAMDYWH